MFAAGGSPCTSPKTQERNWEGLRTNLWISTVKSNQATNQATNLATNWTLNLWINYKLSSRLSELQIWNHHNSWLWAVSVYKTTLIKVVVGVSAAFQVQVTMAFLLFMTVWFLHAGLTIQVTMDYSLYKLTTSLIISWAGLVVTAVKNTTEENLVSCSYGT